MKYCYNCNRITAGEPLFCNFCGRSYNMKLCPRRHPNPRNAEACSQCGSRDLSTPQPKVPLWAPILEFCLSLIPGLALAALSIGLVALILRAIFENPHLLFAAALLAVSLGFLWRMWSQIPLWFRKAISNLLRRRREGERRGSGR
jgi:RNA polymerase subunit RPABC4/transcription elongation factor Spt4